MREKKIPIDSALPPLHSVPRMPDAALRWAAGTLDMMAAVFGEKNKPQPIR